MANEIIKAPERQEKFLRVPQIPLSDPAEEEASQLFQKILNQENKWLWDLRVELKNIMSEGVRPLEVYL